MKSFLIASVTGWVGVCAMADIPPEVQTAFAFLSNLHLSAGETNAILSEWNQPTQFQSGTNLISVAVAGENRKWSLSSNEAVLGTVSMNSYGSEFQARLTWALKQTSRSAPPDSNFNSYETPISTEHFALVCQSAAPETFSIPVELSFAELNEDPDVPEGTPMMLLPFHQMPGENGPGTGEFLNNVMPALLIEGQWKIYLWKP